MQSDYDDIRFVNTSCKNNGSELDFEIESYNGSNANIWVEIDSLPAAGKTIAVYYGNASAASGEDVAGTWDGNHKGVWHLGENTGATNQDSTSNSNNGSPKKNPASSTGKIGNALNFDAANETRVEVGKDNSLKLSNYSNWTISLWVKPSSNYQSRKYPVMYSYGDYRASVGVGGKSGGSDKGKIESWRNDSSRLQSNTKLTISGWNHVVVARTPSNTFFYLNGIADGSGSSVSINHDNKGSFIGGYPGYKDGDLRGVIDEVRVSNARRSADWIKQSYQLVQNQSTHVSIGDEVSNNLNGQLTGKLHVDNSFEAFISTSDNTQGTLIGSSSGQWWNLDSFSTNLDSGQDYYLHIKAIDVGGVAGFLGEFEITGTDHKFSNGLTNLSTNTTDWSVSTTGWSNYQPASGYGLNGVWPWWLRSGVDANARWIWSSNNDAHNTNYFTTKISAATSCDTNIGKLDASGIKIGGGGSNTQINNTSEALTIYAAWLAADSPASGLISGSTYNVIASGSSTVDRIDFGGANHDFSGTLAYPGAGAGVTGEDFLVHTSGTLSLPAGDYTIYVESDDGFSFVMDTLFGDTVSFSKFGSSTSGGSNELRYEGTTGNTNTGGSFTLTQDSVFDIAAIFFERGGGDYLEISIANNIRSSAAPSGYEILREGALNGKVKFGQCTSPSQIDHFQIIHDGNGLTCEAETVTIKACTNAYDGSCTLSSDTVTLDFQAEAVTKSTVTFTGSTVVNLTQTTPFTGLTLGISNPSITPSNALVCKEGSNISCDIDFTDAGFRFLNGGSGSSETITNQEAGTSFDIRLQAVKNSNGVCTGLFNGNKNVDLSQENVAPNVGGGLPFSVNGNNIAKHQSVSNTTLNFGANSMADITAIYHDAGQISLHADYDVGGISLTGSSNAFWVSPAELVVSAKQGATSLNGATATATPTHQAGEDFTLTVSAYNSLGVVTPNYSPGQIQFKLARTGPTLSASVNGNLTYAANSVLTTNVSPAFQNVTLSNFDSGISSYSAAHYSEVGLLNLDVQDSNYGSEGITIPASTINIGRFIPHHFEQTIAEDGYFWATCNAGTTFAYSGQKDEATDSIGAISYLTNPVLKITALNKQGVITQNYYQDSQGSANDFMKLSAADVSITAPSLDQVTVGVDSNKLSLTADMNTGTLSQNDLTVLPNVVALPKGILHYELSENDNFFYNHSANALVAPFTSDIDFSTATIEDSDDANVSTTVDASPTGVEIRFGRLVLKNSFGPETSNLPQPMQIEHFDGTDFSITSNNDCVTYEKSKLSLSNISLDPALTNRLGDTGSFSSGKTTAIELEATGARNQGQIGVSYETFNWLKFDWNNNGAYTDNPSAVATFGLYRGNDRIIYWREVSN